MSQKNDVVNKNTSRDKVNFSGSNEYFSNIPVCVMCRIIPNIVYRNISDTVYRNNSDTVYRTVVQFTFKCKEIPGNVQHIFRIQYAFYIPYNFSKNILAENFSEHGIVYLFFEFPDESNF